ncbi:MAG: succinate dehydrogenase, cytochrome b556 subunit [Pseudomonadota bacterium]
MADVNRGNRPLSPHLTIYRPQITSMMSIMHRVTGVAMTLGSALVVWWLLAAATSEEYFDFANGVLTSWIGNLIWIGMTFALAYHFCNGIRHLIWDMGFGFELDQVEMSGKISVGAAGVLTVLIWLLA